MASHRITRYDELPAWVLRLGFKDKAIEQWPPLPLDAIVTMIARRGADAPLVAPVAITNFTTREVTWRPTAAQMVAPDGVYKVKWRVKHPTDGGKTWSWPEEGTDLLYIEPAVGGNDVADPTA